MLSPALRSASPRAASLWFHNWPLLRSCGGVHLLHLLPLLQFASRCYGAISMMDAGAPRSLALSWLLLLHQLPATPAYLRVKVWRRLKGIGAVAVKNAVHALPTSEGAQEDFE